MTQPAPKPRRTNADYRWTRPRIFAFLDALARTASVAASAREVGMSRQAPYRLRRRLGPEFAQVWDEALAVAAEKRAAQGYTGPAQGYTAR